MKKPETEVRWTQTPAQGDQTDDAHATDVEAEAIAHGTPVTPIATTNDNQGGN